jgi:hypothetical protein
MLDQVRGTLRVKHYAYRTEEAYVNWIRRYILSHDKRYSKEMEEFCGKGWGYNTQTDFSAHPSATQA